MPTDDVVTVTRGTTPLVVSFPHAGTEIPARIARRTTPAALPRAGADEIAERRARWWQPYHDALAAELARVRDAHGVVVLWDAHSIASVLPRFFEGRLADLNLGTADGRSCAPAVQAAAVAVLEAQH